MNIGKIIPSAVVILAVIGLGGFLAGEEMHPAIAVIILGIAGLLAGLLFGKDSYEAIKALVLIGALLIGIIIVILLFATEDANKEFEESTTGAEVIIGFFIIILLIVLILVMVGVAIALAISAVFVTIGAWIGIQIHYELFSKPEKQKYTQKKKRR